MIHKISAEPRASETVARIPTLAGMFYPSRADELKEMLASFFDATVTSVENPKGILVPHAGFVYSGKIAAISYARVAPEFDGTFIVIGTSHAGLTNTTTDLDWKTPLGTVSSDTELVAHIARALPLDNDAAREQENSLETQMPFIAYRFPKAKVAPILMGDQSLDGANDVAAAVISALNETKRHVIIIASGDGSHYVPAKKAETDDLTALAALKNLDVEKFYDALLKIQPSMCGYGCIASMAEITSYMGASSARVLMYGTSGDITGDMRSVVGYASMEMI